MTKIIILGDSITAGASDPNRIGWAQRLKADFEENHQHKISIFGVDGATSAYICKYIDYLLKKYFPECIIIAIGINDSIYTQSTLTNEVSFNEFSRNIAQLINKSKKYTPKIIFIGLTNVDESKVQPIPWVNTKWYFNKHIRKYDCKIKSLAKKYNTYYISLFKTLSTEELADGLHPNSKAHQKIYRKIKEFLIKTKIAS